MLSIAAVCALSGKRGCVGRSTCCKLVCFPVEVGEWNTSQLDGVAAIYAKMAAPSASTSGCSGEAGEVGVVCAVEVGAVLGCGKGRRRLPTFSP